MLSKIMDEDIYWVNAKWHVKMTFLQVPSWQLSLQVMPSWCMCVCVALNFCWLKFQNYLIKNIAPSSPGNSQSKCKLLIMAFHYYWQWNIFFLGLVIRHTDPLYIKTKKLEILTTIASDSNVEEVVTELR